MLFIGVLAGIALVLLWLMLTHWTEMIVRHDTPVPVSVANNDLSFPLPATAKEVYLHSYAGGLQDSDVLVRFDVSPEDLDRAVDDLLVRNNGDYTRSLPYLKQELSSAPGLAPRKQFQPVTWWDVTSIRNGYYRGEETSFALQIWVDSDHHRVYVHQND